MNTKTTRDSIELDDDLNEAIEHLMNIPEDELTDEERAEFNTYFVSVSRMRYKLINATHLEALMARLE